jgi:hypothetical protein
MNPTASAAVTDRSHALGDGPHRLRLNSACVRTIQFTSTGRFAGTATAGTCTASPHRRTSSDQAPNDAPVPRDRADRVSNPKRVAANPRCVALVARPQPFSPAFLRALLSARYRRLSGCIRGPCPVRRVVLADGAMAWLLRRHERDRGGHPEVSASG